MTEEACAHTLTCSAASADSPLPHHGPDTEPSDSARSTPSASASLESTGQMSLFGETCERSQEIASELLWPTPVAMRNRKSARALWQESSPPGLEQAVEMAAGIMPVEFEGLELTNMGKRMFNAFPSSPPAIPASHSQSPGSDWARKMTATYGRRLGDYWLSSDPPDSWVRTCLATSIWVSTTCYLTWKKSATPQGRWLFRLVPWTPRTGGIGSGLLHTPTVTANQTSPSMVNRDPGSWGLMPTPRVEGFDAGMHRGKPDSLHSYAKLWPTPKATKSGPMPEGTTPTGITADGRKVTVGLENAVKTEGMKLNSAWVSRMMGYPDDWLTLDGEEIP